MAIPTNEEVSRPALEFLAQHLGRDVHIKQELVSAIAERFNLTEEEKNPFYRFGEVSLSHNVIWACVRLSKAELVEMPKQGYVRIASAGKSYLDTYSGKIGIDELDSNCPAYKKWLDGGKLLTPYSNFEDEKDGRNEKMALWTEIEKSIPTDEAASRPTLEFLAQHPERDVHIEQELMPAIAERFNLTEKEKNLICRFGETALYGSVSWACLRLFRAELIKMSDDYVRITPAGESYLNTYSGKIGITELEKNCPVYKKWLDGGREPKTDGDS